MRIIGNFLWQCVRLSQKVFNESNKKLPLKFSTRWFEMKQSICKKISTIIFFITLYTYFIRRSWKKFYSKIVYETLNEKSSPILWFRSSYLPPLSPPPLQPLPIPPPPRNCNEEQIIVFPIFFSDVKRVFNSSQSSFSHILYIRE